MCREAYGLMGLNQGKRNVELIVNYIRDRE